MKLGIILSSTDPETVFNALRPADYSLKHADSVRIFLMRKGVEIDRIDDSRFDVRGLANAVRDDGGEFLACGACLKLRASEGSDMNGAKFSIRQVVLGPRSRNRSLGSSRSWRVGERERLRGTRTKKAPGDIASQHSAIRA